MKTQTAPKQKATTATAEVTQSELSAPIVGDSVAEAVGEAVDVGVGVGVAVGSVVGAGVAVGVGVGVAAGLKLTTTCTVAEAVFPAASVTVRRTVKVPTLP